MAGTSIKPVIHLVAKIEAQKGEQCGNNRNQDCDCERCFIHDNSITQGQLATTVNTEACIFKGLMILLTLAIKKMGLHLPQWVHLDVQLFRQEISIPESNTAKP
jgi:hypothetical protein